MDPDRVQVELRAALACLADERGGDLAGWHGLRAMATARVRTALLLLDPPAYCPGCFEDGGHAGGPCPDAHVPDAL